LKKIENKNKKTRETGNTLGNLMKQNMGICKSVGKSNN
jgi:hypothetical protein